MTTTNDLPAIARFLGELTGGLLDRSAEAGLDRIWRAATGAPTVLTAEQLADAKRLIDALDTPPPGALLDDEADPGADSASTDEGLVLLETFHEGFVAKSPLRPAPTAVMELVYQRSAARHLQAV